MTDQPDCYQIVLPHFDGQLVDTAQQLEIALRRLGESDAVLGEHGADALTRLRSAITNGERLQLRAPDQGHEHEPIILITLASSLTALTDLLEELRRVVLETRYRSGLDAELSRALEMNGRDLDAGDALELVARLHGLVDLDNHLELTVLTDAFERARSGLGGVELDELQEAAYRRLRDRWVAMWRDHSPLEPWTC